MMRWPVPHGHSNTAHFIDACVPTTIKVLRGSLLGTNDCDWTYVTCRILGRVRWVLRSQSIVLPTRSIIDRETGQHRQ